MKENRKEKGHATWAKHDYHNRKYSKGIPNTQAISETDKEAAKALICEYREWEQNMDEEQTEAWCSIPKCVSKRANYIPNSIWVPKHISGEDEHFLDRQSVRLVEDQYRHQVEKAKAKEYDLQATAQGFTPPTMARMARRVRRLLMATQSVPPLRANQPARQKTRHKPSAGHHLHHLQ